MNRIAPIPTRHNNEPDDLFNLTDPKILPTFYLKPKLPFLSCDKFLSYKKMNYFDKGVLI